ncbi:uncharacterized protein VP01_3901g2 [Puccinia sorghi]|uniref:Uncharacterized protein n=1 Tax=Puccinia sorghi TaxID=27349 RepID=A0A0L6UST9_9BASI|nr:uncharacterized protein VP01_3901g2 [Puccinia sorghi]
MSSSICSKSRAALISPVAHHSSRVSRSCIQIQKQFHTNANPVFQPDNAVPTTDAKGFQKRERGEEGRYAREKVGFCLNTCPTCLDFARSILEADEVAELKELRDELARHKAKIDQLEQSV